MARRSRQGLGDLALPAAVPEPPSEGFELVDDETARRRNLNVAAVIAPRAINPLSFWMKTFDEDGDHLLISGFDLWPVPLNVHPGWIVAPHNRVLGVGRSPFTKEITTVESEGTILQEVLDEMDSHPTAICWG